MALSLRDRRTRTITGSKRVKVFSSMPRTTGIHPGEQLAEQLQEIEMSAAELGRQLNVPANRITGILKGQRAVTGDTALRLAHFFHTSPEFWLNLQTAYDLHLAEERSGEAIKSLPTLPRGSVKAGKP